MTDSAMTDSIITGSPPLPPAAKSPPLWNRGFIALLVTQFLVALNDNVFRWLIIPIGKCAVGWSENPDQIRMVGALAFLLPFLLFTSFAGYCSDRFSRRRVIISCKIAEVLILLLGTWAILSQSVPFMLAVLFLLGAQSAFFSPAKYSALPMVVPNERISEANGYYSMTTMMACIGGQLLGGTLFVLTTFFPDAGTPINGSGGMQTWGIWSATLLGIGVAGLISSFFVPKLKPVDPTAKFPFNPFYQTFADLRSLFRHRFVFWIAMGSSFFWGLGALAQSNIDKFGEEILHLRQDSIMFLLVALTFGLAIGAVIAGKCSRGRIEYGLVPLGAMGIILFGLILALTPTVVTDPGTYASIFTGAAGFGAIGLVLLGVSAGVYDIPLLTALQTESPPAHRGRILAAYNFYSFAAMAIFSLTQGMLADKGVGGLSANAIWVFCAVITLPVLIFTLRAFFVPWVDVTIYYLLWFIYRPRVIDVENVPNEGGVLIVANHVSYLDSPLIYTALKRNARFIGHKNFIPRGIPTLMARGTGVIPIDPGNTKNVVAVIRQVREALSRGEIVCIFAEGGITRTGQLRRFEPGFLSMLKGNDDVPVIPVWIGGLWGSLFAYTRPAGEWKRPRRLLQRVTVAFGKPIFRPKNAAEVERAVEELGVETMDPRRFPTDRHYRLPLEQMIFNNRKFSRITRFIDTTGMRLTGGSFLLRALVARRVFAKFCRADEKMVGLLLPTSVGGVLANVALGLNHKIAVNLNYTLSNETLDYCSDLTGIQHIITSRKFLQKFPQMRLNAKFLVIEDVLKNVSKRDKFLALLESFLPTWLLIRWLGLNKIKPDDILTIVFTSGSTGLPKGAMLSHHNIASNVQAFYQLFLPGRQDRILGVLPLFHSFGYTATLWGPLLVPMGGLYHFSPLDAKTIGELARKERATLFPASATFFRQYLRRCPPEDFANVTLSVGGAEKLPQNLSVAWKEKFGQELVEGYGTTELSPVVSANLPQVLQPDTYHKYLKYGSIGIPLAGIMVRITDPETGEILGPNTPGMLEVKGANVMLGYYKDPEKTAQVLHDGWYQTGDIAKMDEDRFIFITGRLSRISKIGGEMVPHIFIEEEIEKIVRRYTPDDADSSPDSTATPDEESPLTFAVTAVPDDKKGERIVVLHTALATDPETICRELADAGLPALWVPAANDFHPVETIPILGTGKPDLRAIANTARTFYSSPQLPTEVLQTEHSASDGRVFRAPH